MICRQQQQRSVRISALGFEDGGDRRLVRIFWATCAIWGNVLWLERVGSDLNISDVPTRNGNLLMLCESEGPLTFENKLSEMATEGLPRRSIGFSDLGELVGRFFLPHVTPSCSVLDGVK